MDETRCPVAGDTLTAPGALGTRPSASKAHWCREGTSGSMGGAGSLEFPWSQPWHCVRVPRARTLLAPVRAARTHPGTGCPGTEDTAQAGAWCQGPCPGSTREEFQLHLRDRGGRGARLLTEHPLPAAGLPGIASIYGLPAGCARCLPSATRSPTAPSGKVHVPSLQP